IQVYLFGSINQLKVVEVNKKITGILEFDLRKKRNDTLPRIDSDYYNFGEMDFSNVNMGRDMKPPSAQLLSDPIARNAGVTLASVGIPDNSSLELIALRKRISFKKDFPNKLKYKFGEYFFFTTLKIPEENYYNFLLYCEPLGIEQLYKNGEIFKLIT